MPPKPLLVLGLMSGTSADAIDVALAQISGAPPHLNAKLLNHTSISFPAQLRKEILRVAEQQPISAGDLSQLNFRLGETFAEAALAACRRFPAVIAARTGITTVADFRPADIAQGGQGAPLVPYADYLLYRHPKLGRVSLNLGGIANVTVIPANAKPSQVFAFDTGPANMLIDALVAHFTKGRQRFDKAGRLALKGRVIDGLYAELRKDPSVELPPPKSTGREYYGHTYLQRLLRLGRKYHARPNDLIRAATNFTANSIVYALHRFVLPHHKIHELIISGGGARNALVCALIAGWLTADNIKVLDSSRFRVPVDAKEAFAFALLAYETFHQRPSNVPSATGAHHPAILGKISYAPSR